MGELSRVIPFAALALATPGVGVLGATEVEIIQRLPPEQQPVATGIAVGLDLALVAALAVGTFLGLRDSKADKEYYRQAGLPLDRKERERFLQQMQRDLDERLGIPPEGKARREWIKEQQQQIENYLKARRGQ